MMRSKKIFIYLLFSAMILTACSKTSPLSNEKQSIQNNFNDFSTETNNDENKLIQEPIDDAIARATKKPFGVKISPDNSPVSPEKFSGYHTGVDFETFPNEAELDINIYAICAGPIILKRYVSGYGGVIVQQCALDNDNVTVVYGHLRLSSISSELNQILKQGQQIGMLGQGFSAETDGERKHLHLGIHKGQTINLLGYVETSNLLDEWIDPITLIK